MNFTFGQLVLALTVAGGGGGAVAVGAFRLLGEKWLESKFAARLQNLRHEHDKQIEDIRLTGARTLDRSARLSEREFDVSAEAWSLVFDTYVKTSLVLPGIRFGGADFYGLSDEMACRVMEDAKFESWEIEQVLQKRPADRNAAFMDRQQAHEIIEAKKANRDASFYLAKKALFLEKDVHERLTAFVNDAWTAVFDWEMVRSLRGQGGGLPENMRRADEEFRATSEQRINELEQLVRERFWGQPGLQLEGSVVERK